MNKHWWYTVDHGMGIRCEKCGAYANMEHDDDFHEIENTKNCPYVNGDGQENTLCDTCGIKDCDNCPC